MYENHLLVFLTGWDSYMQSLCETTLTRKFCYNI